jgi:hypothetical protein
MLIKIRNRNALTSLSVSSHADVQLDSSEPLTAVLSLHWLRPRSIDAEIGTIIEKALKRGCNCMERPETLVIKLNTMLKSPINSIM